jgi:hypothetical protein
VSSKRKGIPEPASLKQPEKSGRLLEQRKNSLEKIGPVKWCEIVDYEAGFSLIGVHLVARGENVR